MSRRSEGSPCTHTIEHIPCLYVGRLATLRLSEEKAGAIPPLQCELATLLLSCRQSQDLVSDFVGRGNVPTLLSYRRFAKVGEARGAA